MMYESFAVVHSELMPGVSFRVAKMSFGRRVELTRRVRELAQKAEFHAASDDPKEKLEAMLLAAEVDRLYLLWGLSEVSGLELDGAPATPETLASVGPEDIFREALAAVKGQCGLTESERKN
jgi:ATP-dependent protease HslVU (ClpYQ) peptidase subunit